MTGYTDPAFGPKSHDRRSDDARRSHAIRKALGLTKRTRNTRDLVFGELRTALQALRSLHTPARGIDTAGANLKPSYSMSRTSMPSFRGPERCIITPDERAALCSFIIDEDPEHLEEAVLISMDYANGDSVHVAWAEAAQQRYHLSRDSTDARIDRRYAMKLGRYVTDDP